MPWGKDTVIQPGADGAPSASSGDSNLPSWGRGDQAVNVVNDVPEHRLLDVMNAPSLGDVVSASLDNNRSIDAGKATTADLGRQVGATLNQPELRTVQAPEAAGRGFVAGGGQLLQTLGALASGALPAPGIAPTDQLRATAEQQAGAPLTNAGDLAVNLNDIGPGERLDGLGSKVAFMGAKQIPTLAAAIGMGGGLSAEALVPQAVRSVPVLGNVLGNVAAGAPTAAALTAESGLSNPDLSLGDLAKEGALNLAMAGVPGAIGSGPLARTATGGAIGAGLAAGGNLINGQSPDAAQTIVGALTGAALAGGHAPAEKLDPHLQRYVDSAGDVPPTAAPSGPLALPAPDLATAATGGGEPVAPAAPSAPAARAPFDAAQATKDFHADPRAALDTLDHPTLVQLASDVGLDVANDEKRVAIISKIAGQPQSFLSQDVLPEYLTAAQDAHAATQAPSEAPSAPDVPAEPSVPGLGDLARSLDPSATIPVDTQGVAYTPEQGGQLLSDAIQSQAGATTRALPPAVTTVDSAGNAMNSEAVNRQLAQNREDIQAGVEAAKARRDLGITPDIERTQGPRWQRAAQNADDARAMQDYRDADDSEMVGQRSDDAPQWWMAGQHASDEFDRNVNDMAQAREAQTVSERRQANDVLSQHGIAPEDHDEALGFSQLIQRALDAGAEPLQIMAAGQQPDNPSRARALWALTNRLEGERNAQGTAVQQAGAPDRAAQDQGAAAAGSPELDQPGNAATEAGQAGQEPISEREGRRVRVDPEKRIAELDHVDDFSRELSRDQGNVDAKRLGLKDAVDKALGPSAKDVQYLHGYEGLPAGMYERVKARNSVSRKGSTVAMYRPDTGEVFIFTDKVTNPRTAVWSAAHEIAGHAGLRAFLGDKLDPALNIARKNPTVAKLADAIYEQRNIGERMRQTGRPQGDGVLLSTEEALAELAAAVRTGDYDKINERYGVEVPPGIRERIRSVINDFVQRLKALIDDLFGKHSFSDEDVRDLLDEAWKAAQKREAGASSKPGSELEQVNETHSDSAPISLQAVRRALEARGLSPDVIAGMSKEQLRAEQSELRARSTPSPEQAQPEPAVTGIKNATKEEERALKGKAAVEHELAQTNPEQYARAKAMFDADPHAGQILAARVVADKKAITPEESILLSLDAMRIINARQQAYETAEKALAKGDEATRLAALSMVRSLDGQMEANDIAARYSGTRAGQALQARKLMIQQDYSMARMVLRAKVAKGAELTEAERSRIEKLSSEIDARSEALDAREAKLRAMETEAKPAQVKRQARAKFDDLASQLKKIAEKDQLKPGCVV